MYLLPCCYTSCDDSFLAEDTTVPCRTEDNVNNGHHCCKTTTRKGKARPKDFYCFLDRGSPEANWFACLAMADNPPKILGVQPAPRSQPATDNQPTQAPTSLRAGQQSDEEMTSRPKDLFFALLASLLCLFLFKKLAGNYLWARKRRAARIYTRSISDHLE